MEEMTRAYKGSPINIFLNSFQFSVDFCFVLKFQIDLEFCKTFLTGGSVEKTKREVDFAYWFRYFEVNVWNVTRRSGFFFLDLRRTQIRNGNDDDKMKKNNVRSIL
jgi:hypothetical protein